MWEQLMHGIKGAFDVFTSSVSDLLGFLFGTLGEALRLTEQQLASLPAGLTALLSVPVVGIFFSTALIGLLVWLFIYLVIP